MNAIENIHGEVVCPVSFKHFFYSTLLGNLAALPARAVARKLYENEHEMTKATAANVVGLAAFWLIGGLTYVWLTRRP